MIVSFDLDGTICDSDWDGWTLSGVLIGLEMMKSSITPVGIRYLIHSGLWVPVILVLFLPEDPCMSGM